MDTNPDNRITFLARLNFRDDRRVFGIRQTDRRAHLYIIGKTGTGKSTVGPSISPLLRLEAAIARELQCSAVLRHCPHNVIGSASGDLRFDFQRHAHRRSDQPDEAIASMGPRSDDRGNMCGWFLARPFPSRFNGAAIR